MLEAAAILAVGWVRSSSAPVQPALQQDVLPTCGLRAGQLRAQMEASQILFAM